MDFFAKIFIDLKLLTIFAKRFPSHILERDKNMPLREE